MDATKLLKNQHEEVKQLFEEVESLGDSEFKRRSELVEQILMKLELHMQIEEEILYPVAKEIDSEMVLESYEEHHMAKISIDEIRNTQASNERFMAKLTVLKEMVEHHVQEEEGELFPELMEKMSVEQLNQLGVKMQNRFRELEHGVKSR